MISCFKLLVLFGYSIYVPFTNYIELIGNLQKHRKRSIIPRQPTGDGSLTILHSTENIRYWKGNIT